MKSKRITAGLAIVAMLLGLTTQAFADHDNRSYRAMTVSSNGYARNHGHRAGPVYDYATVISSRPIVRYVTVTTPVKECWQDTEYYTVQHRRRGAGGALAGAIIGGVVGHQFGSGRGNDAATVAGTLIGAAIGSGGNRHSGYETSHSRPVTRCETQYREHQEERIDGYDVVYRYHGQKYATRMPHDPGNRIRIRVDIRPAG